MTRKSWPPLKIGKVYGTKKVLRLAFSRGSHIYYEVQCLQCKNKMLAHIGSVWVGAKKKRECRICHRVHTPSFTVIKK